MDGTNPNPNPNPLEIIPVGVPPDDATVMKLLKTPIVCITVRTKRPTWNEMYSC